MDDLDFRSRCWCCHGASARLSKVPNPGVTGITILRGVAGQGWRSVARGRRGRNMRLLARGVVRERWVAVGGTRMTDRLAGDL